MAPINNSKSVAVAAAAKPALNRTQGGRISKQTAEDNGQPKLTAKSQLNIATNAIARHGNTIKRYREKIEQIDADVAEIEADPNRGYYRLRLNSLKEKKREFLAEIRFAEARLLEARRNKETWSVFAKEEKEADKAKAAEQRKQRIIASRPENEYKGTARDSDVSVSRPVPSKSLAETASKPSCKAPVKGTIKRKHEDPEEDEAQQQPAMKKTKANETPTPLTMEQLNFAKIPKAPKAPEDDSAGLHKSHRLDAQSTKRPTGRVPKNMLGKRKLMEPEVKAEDQDKPTKKMRTTKPAPESKTKVASKKTTAPNSSKKRSSSTATAFDASSSQGSSSLKNSQSRSSSKAETTKSTSTPGTSPGVTPPESKAVKPTKNRMARRSEPAEPERLQKQEQKQLPPKGLLNTGDSGSLSAALQLLDAALSNKHLAAMKETEKPDTYGLSEEDCAKYDSTLRDSAWRAAFEEKLSAARAQIESLSEEERPHLGQYLGQVLQKLRNGDTGEVSPRMLQTVLESQTAEDESQADVAECLMRLASAVNSTPGGSPDLFEHLHLKVPQAETRIVTDETGEEMEEDVKWSIDDLIETALRRKKDGAAEKNSHQDLNPTGASQNKGKYSKNVVLSIDRAQSEAPLDMDLHKIFFGEQRYKVKAAIHLETVGASTRYAAFRKVAGTWWRLRDDAVDEVEGFQVQDSHQSQAVVVLLRKQ